MATTGGETRADPPLLLPLLPFSAPTGVLADAVRAGAFPTTAAPLLPLPPRSLSPLLREEDTAELDCGESCGCEAEEDAARGSVAVCGCVGAEGALEGRWSVADLCRLVGLGSGLKGGELSGEDVSVSSK